MMKNYEWDGQTSTVKLAMQKGSSLGISTGNLRAQLFKLFQWSDPCLIIGKAHLDLRQVWPPPCAL
ncbi:MAG TPA: hypothetical protein VGH65_06530 [Verrucomicrobiaceae bacterium]